MGNSLFDIRETYLTDTHAEMRRIIQASMNDRHMSDMMMYHLGWINVDFQPCKNEGSLSLWPTICLLVCDTVSGDCQRALPAAAALNFLYHFSLVHSEINDNTSSHSNDVWKIWGMPQAINTGDALYAISYKSLLRLDVSPRTLLEILKMFNHMVMELCEIQYLNIDFKAQNLQHIADYEEQISRRMATFFETSAAIGAMVGTENQEIIQHFKKYGRNIGMAFKARDGTSEYIGSPDADYEALKKEIINTMKMFASTTCLE
jgi:geranylgeranyl diphosphate synthase type I